MGSARSTARPRGSRRRTGKARADLTGTLSQSHKRLLQAGSAAAALGSVLALVLTIGDRVSGLFADGGAARVSIEGVELETMSLRTFLVTKKAHKPSQPFGYSRNDLDSDVLAVNVRARYERSSRGVSFPVRLTLQTRDSEGDIVEVGQQSADYVLEASDDACGCHDFFYLPTRRRDYRVEVQVLRPNTPDDEPLAEVASDWYPSAAGA